MALFGVFQAPSPSLLRSKRNYFFHYFSIGAGLALSCSLRSGYDCNFCLGMYSFSHFAVAAGGWCANAIKLAARCPRRCYVAPDIAASTFHAPIYVLARHRGPIKILRDPNPTQYLSDCDSANMDIPQDALYTNMLMFVFITAAYYRRRWRRRPKRFQTRPWLLRRDEQGHHQNLLQELRFARHGTMNCGSFWQWIASLLSLKCCGL